MVRRRRQSGLVRTNAIYVALSYKRTPRTEVAHTNCLVGSSNTSAGKTPVPGSGVPFVYPSAGGKPYYSGGLSSNRSIDPTSISS
jgi:hypothetical protein